MAWIIELWHRQTQTSMGKPVQRTWTERDFTHPLPTKELAERLATSLRLSKAKPATVYDVTVAEVPALGAHDDAFPERSIGNKIRYRRVPRALKQADTERRLEGR